MYNLFMDVMVYGSASAGNFPIGLGGKFVWINLPEKPGNTSGVSCLLVDIPSISVRDFLEVPARVQWIQIRL